MEFSQTTHQFLKYYYVNFFFALTSKKLIILRTHFSPATETHKNRLIDWLIFSDLFRKRGNFEKAVVEHDADWYKPEKRELLRAMMMTVCDVAAITKPWSIQESVIWKIEFIMG